MALGVVGDCWGADTFCELMNYIKCKARTHDDNRTGHSDVLGGARRSRMVMVLLTVIVA